MFCVQEADSPHSDPFGNEKDPLGANAQSESSDEEPESKRIKMDHSSPSLNLKVYQIPAYKTPSSLSIFPTTTPSLPMFVNNPLNLANPLALAANNLQNAKDVVKSLHSRYSLPAKLTITPVPSPVQNVQDSGGIVRYKKNGEVAKKRGPPKGYKRKPKDLSQSFSNGALLQQAQNTILTSLLAAANTQLTALSQASKASQPVTVADLTTPIKITQLPPVPRVRVPEGVELIELELEPEDWFPAEPYKMSFSRKKNPKWKTFPFQCEYCFKGYRVASTLISHAAARHGAAPKVACEACPCCPHAAHSRKDLQRHMRTHRSRKHRLYCLYCLPITDPKEPYVNETEKYPFEKYPQFWYASEESLRLHKKRKHPYAAMLNQNWFYTWGESMPNS